MASAEEPWADADPKTPPKRYALGDFGATVGAEYRAQLTYINPISLNTTTQRRATFIEHRLRLDADRKSTRLNSSHGKLSRMPSSA